MTPEELKALTTALQELSLSSKETANAIHGFSNEIRRTQRLWRKSANSKLIKISSNRSNATYNISALYLQ